MHSVAGVTPYDPETGRYGGAMAYGEDILAFNPYAIFLNAKNTETVQQMNGNLFMDWKVFKGIHCPCGLFFKLSSFFQETSKHADRESL